MILKIKKIKHRSKPTEQKIIQREKRMVEAMIMIYCKEHHNQSKNSCSICSKFKEYAKKRLESCRYQEKKPVCGRCGLSCYNSENKYYAESVFNFAGPRMMLQYPRLGLHHLFDAFRNNRQLKKSE